MTAKVTSTPATELPGSVIGRPIRIPFVLLCTNGERFCGKTWTANSRHQLAEYMAERRTHEQNCRGGLIIATA
jgi:hypothetical protein